MTHDEQIEAIEQDLKGKLFRRDWHGVMDCAADLRELESKNKGYKLGYKKGLRKCKIILNRGENYYADNNIGKSILGE